jgi:sulfur carrier protein ThiS
MSAPTLVHSPHPLLAGAGRELINEKFLPGEKVAGYLRRLNIDIDRPLALQLNAQPLPRDEWATTAVKAGDQIALRALVQLGGDGDSNKVLRTIATIAVMVYAPQLSGAMGAGSVGTALISVGGMLAVNALLPPPTPQLRDMQQGNEPSPTYSLSGGANRARRFEPLPLVIGAHRIFPDLDAQQYTEFRGDDQYLFMSLNFGLSDIELSDYRIGNTPLSSFSDFNQTTDLQESGPDGVLDWFPGNVDSLSVGVQLESSISLVANGTFDGSISGWYYLWGQWWIRDGGMKSTGIKTISEEDAAEGHDHRLKQLISLPSAGNYYLSFEARKVWSNQDLSLYYDLSTAPILTNSPGRHLVRLDGFSVGEHELGFQSPNVVIDNVALNYDDPALWVTRTSSAGSIALAVDIAGYLFYAGDVGIEQHAVTLEIQYSITGAETWLDFIPGGRVTLTNSTREPLRKTYNLDVVLGQYDVRVRRISPADSGDRFTSNISWQQLRSYQNDSSEYLGQQRAAIRIRASGQLSGRIDAFNALATGNYEAWNGAAWVLQATSNPAWLFRWFSLGKFDANGRRMFGAGKTDAALDIPAIQAWGAWCDAKGLSCNIVLDRRMNVYDVLSAIAACGRATVSFGSGLLGAVWDADSQPAVAQFGMGNIVADSFRIEYLTRQLADEVVVEFVNPALDWLPDTVRAPVPGTVSPVNPISMQLWGVTNEAQATKAANLMAAAQQYRRRRVSWETDLEGMVVQRGDVVTLSHDLSAGWGYSGRLVAATVNDITLDIEVPFTSAQDHYVGLREVDGSYNIHPVNYVEGTSNVLTFTTPLAQAPAAPLHDTMWFFEPSATPGKLLKIIDIAPVNENRVRITATDEDPLYYAAENNPSTYTPPGAFSSYYPTISQLEVSDTLIPIGRGYGVEVSLKWDVSGSYGGAWVRWRLPGEAWQLLNFTTERGHHFQSPLAGDIELEVVAVNEHANRGAASTAAQTYTIVGNDDPINNVTGFLAGQNGPIAILDWDEVANRDVAGYEIRRLPQGGTDWDAATLIKRVAPGSGITDASIPPGAWTLLIKAYDDNQPPIYSETAATADITMVTTFDVIDSRQEAPDWLGTLDGFVKHHTGVLVVQDQNPASSYGWETFDQYVPTPVNEATYESPEMDIGQVNAVRAWAAAQLRAGPGEVGNTNITIQLDFNDGGGYTGTWTDWTIGERTGQFFKFRLLWNYVPGEAVPVIEAFDQTIDLKERTQRWDELTVPIGGLVLTFTTPFHRKPFVDAQDHNDSEIELVATAFIGGGPYTQFTLLALNKSTRNDVGGIASVVKATGV